VLSIATKESLFILDYHLEKEALLWYIQLLVEVKLVVNCTFL
jgi:hypothetical protein